MQRRDFIRTGVTAGAAALTGVAAPAFGHASLRASFDPARRASFQQSVCKWCFPRMSVEELAAEARRIGLRSIELLGPGDFDTLRRYDLVCAMVNGPSGINNGWNRRENHDRFVQEFEVRLRETADAGFPSVICFSGNRDGMDDEEGLEICEEGLRRIVPVAERLGVTLCMELLNSKVDHPDYMCDNSVWGVELARRLDSDRFKLLYDIYHMQIMEGDVIRTIRENHQYFGHYHTAGNPGRNEIDESQELNYPAIMRAIDETGFNGFVAQEFIPTRDPIASLEEAYQLCNV